MLHIENHVKSIQHHILSIFHIINQNYIIYSLNDSMSIIEEDSKTFLIIDFYLIRKLHLTIFLGKHIDNFRYVIYNVYIDNFRYEVME